MNEEEIIMNEEEIIEFIDQLYGVEREYYNTVRVKNTENIITAIKSAIILYQHEKEKNKKLEEEREGFKRSYKIVMEEKANDYFLMSEVIDLMSEEILNLDINWDTKEGIKEYYFKEARGNGDDK